MLYYEILEDKSIGAYTNNIKVAKNFSWTGITSENIISYNGKNYLESNKPSPTADEIKANKKLEIDNKYKLIFDELAKNLGLANLANDTNTQDSIRKDYNDAQLAYKQELEAI